MGSMFKVLIDVTTGISSALHKVVVGQAINASLHGLLAFCFRDSAGNATTVQLNSEGSVPVSFDAGTTLVAPCTKKTAAEMEVAGVDTRLEITKLTLAPSKTYTCPSFFVTATRWTLFELVARQDVGGTPTEELIGVATLEAGQTAIQWSLLKDKFSTNATVDTKELTLYASHRDNKASDVWGKASCNEVPA